MKRLATYLCFVRFSHSVFALPFALAGALLASRHVEITIRRGRLDSRRDGGGTERRDGVQPPGGRAHGRAEPENVGPRAAARRHEPARGGDVRCRGVGCVHRCRMAVESLVLRALARGARHRVLVLPRKALHHLDAALSRSGDGCGAGRRMAGGRGPRRMGAVAPRACDRLLGRRLRRAVRVPGPRFRSGAWPAIDSRPIRHSRLAGHFARAPRRDDRRALRRCLWLRRSAPLYSLASSSSPRCSSYEQSLVHADDLSQVKRAFDLNGYVGILYLLVLAASHLWPLNRAARSRSRSPEPAARSTPHGPWRRCSRASMHVELVISDYGRRLLRDELGDQAVPEKLHAVPVGKVRAPRSRRAASRSSATAILARRSRAAATAARGWRSCRAR